MYITTRIFLASAAIALCLPFFVSAATLGELQAQLAALLAQLAALEGAGATAPPIDTGSSCPDLTRNLSQGMSGVDVTSLQTFLIAQGHLAAGNSTGYFGVLTEAAVKQFQCKHMQICSGSVELNGYGAVGPKTRERIRKCDFDPVVSSYAQGSYGTGTPPPANVSCTFNGTTIAHGQTVVAYQSSTVTAGGTCQSQMRTCSDGVLSGNYPAASCSVATKNSPTLDDFFKGRAHFQNASESQTVPGGANNATPVFEYPIGSGSYYLFSRILKPRTDGGEAYNIHLFASTDKGASFQDRGPIFKKNDTLHDTWYDPHIAIDNSVTPPKYIMTLECSSQSFSPSPEYADGCVSVTTNPIDTTAWPQPQRIIVGCDNNSGNGCNASDWHSASTPIMLVDGLDKYFSWTVVWLDGKSNGNWAYPTTRVYTAGKKLPNPSKEATPLGYANSGRTLMGTESDIDCTSGWDCNNRDAHDWIKEGSHYYLVYSGANFPSCGARASGNSGTNSWGISLARATSPLGTYKTLDAPAIWGERTDICSAGYGKLVTIDDATYIYYGDISKDMVFSLKRSKLLWGETPPPPAGTYNAFRLNAGQSRVYGQLKLVMQAEGNLVLYGANNSVLWASGTSGPNGSNCAGECYARFQDVGNLVLYGPNNEPYWSSSTDVTYGNQLRLSTSYPYISIVHGNGVYVWQGPLDWSTPPPPPPPPPPADIFTSFRLNAGQSKEFDGLKLVMQSEGNLVLYNAQNQVLWATGSSGPNGGDCAGACYARFQEAGNLVLYNGSNQAYWWNSDKSNSGYKLKLATTFPHIYIINANESEMWRGAADWPNESWTP